MTEVKTLSELCTEEKVFESELFAKYKQNGSWKGSLESWSLQVGWS